MITGEKHDDCLKIGPTDACHGMNSWRKADGQTDGRKWLDEE